MSVTVSPTLAAMGAFRDAVDGVCGLVEQLFALLEKHEQKMDEFRDVRMSEQSTVKDILTALPPDKASALIAALITMSEIVPPIPPEDADDLAFKTKKYLADLQGIRANLHKALDGVV